MTTVSNWYEFALAQIAADSYLDAPRGAGFDFTKAGDLEERLRNGANHYAHIGDLSQSGGALSATRMTSPMVRDFLSAWEVIDHLPNTSSGFSATVLRHRERDGYVLSFRSTESKSANDGGDVERDSSAGANGQISEFGFAWAQLLDMESYYADLRLGVLKAGGESAGAALADWLATPGNELDVTGYSLGGHLAQVFTLLHEDDIRQTYTFNGAGFGAIARFDNAFDFADEIRSRLNLLRDAMADPYGFIDNVSPGDFQELGFGVVDEGGSLSRHDAVDLLLSGRDDRPYVSIYDDPLFRYALRALPDDTIGAFDISVSELVGAVREQITANEKITNLFGKAITGDRFAENIVAGAGQITGNWVPVFIEDQPLLASRFDLWPLSQDALLRNFGPTHSISLIADSLAVMNLYTSIDPALLDPGPAETDSDVSRSPVHRLNRLFAAMTPDRARLLAFPRGEGATLETAIDALGRLFLADEWTPVPSSDANGAYGDIAWREKFHGAIERLRGVLFEDGGLKPEFSDLRVESLLDTDASALAASAREDIAYRYALRQLDPFVVTGNDAIFAAHNLADANGTGILEPDQFSDDYLLDRARFLDNRIRANEASGRMADGSSFVFSDATTEFYDERLGERLYEARTGHLVALSAGETVINGLAAGVIPRIAFAHTQALEGSVAHDRLYGQDGNDVLYGLEGRDVLDGAGGDDVLYANGAANGDDDAADTLRGGKGSDTYHAHVGDIVDDRDGAGRVYLGTRLLGPGWRESGDPAGSYTSGDGHHSYVYDSNARTLTVRVKSGDTDDVLRIDRFAPGTLGIFLNENPHPGKTEFAGSDGDDDLVLGPGGTEISGFIAGRRIESNPEFEPRLERIVARGGSDVLTVAGDVPGLEIFGDYRVGTTAADGHDVIAIDLDRVANDNVAPDQESGGRLHGGAGNDDIRGGRRNDTIDGGSGNDRLSGHAGDDRIAGGDDEISPAGYGGDVIDGGPGNDELLGQGGHDVILGGEGSDVIAGGSGNDVLYGDVASYGYHIGDYGAWTGPRHVLSESFLYTDDPGEGAVIVRPITAGEFSVFREVPAPAAGADRLSGGAGDDHLLGGAGNDVLAGGADRDLLEGEAGDDALEGGDGNDTLYGDFSPVTYAAQTSVIAAGEAADGDWTLAFRAFPAGPPTGGDDLLDGGAATDVLFGGAGDDTLDGGRFDRSIDVLSGGIGDDTYLFGFGDGTTLVSDDGGSADRVRFRPGVSPGDLQAIPDDSGRNLVVTLTLNGVDLGDELIISDWASAGRIEMFEFDNGAGWTAADPGSLPDPVVDESSPGRQGSSVLAATNGADTGIGDTGHDEVFLLAGDDWFAGGAGDDRLFAGDGSDEVRGNDGSDLIVGEAGDDRLFGGDGEDSLFGGDGADMLAGGQGDDTLNGNAGADDLLGGRGNDTYVFDRGDGNDFIRDDGGTLDRVRFASGISPDDVTIERSGSSLILDIRDANLLVGDRITLVDTLLADTTVELIEFAGGIAWNRASLEARLPDAWQLVSGANVTGGPNATTYTLSTVPDDDFSIIVSDAGGIDTLDLRTATSGSFALTPTLTTYSVIGADLVLGVTIESTVSTVPARGGRIRLEDFYSADGFIETIRFGAVVLDETNAPPVLRGALADQVIDLDRDFSFTVPGGTFADSPFDYYVLSADTGDAAGLPQWLAFDPERGIFSGTPRAGDEGIVTISVTATDSRRQAASTSFELNVGNVNVAPRAIAPVEVIRGVEGTPLAVSLPDAAFHDPNPGDSLDLTATLEGGGELPAWLDFEPSSATFSGTPGMSDTGPLRVIVRASDSGGLSASAEAIVNVAYLNDPPQASGTFSDLTVTEQIPFTYSPGFDSFSDPDVVHGDRLTYRLSRSDGGALPGWLSFDESTLTLSGRPVAIFDDTSIGLRLTATDTAGLRANADFTLRVLESDRAPEWLVPHETLPVSDGPWSTRNSVTAALPDGTYVIVWEAADRDGDGSGIFARRYSQSGVASGVAFPVNTTTTDDQRSFVVTALKQGGFVVSWVSLHEADGNQVPPLHAGGGVYAQQFDGAGARVGTEKRVSHVLSGIQNQPAIAALDDGGYVISWFSQFSEQGMNNGEYGLGESGLYARRYRAGGQPVADPVRLLDVGISNHGPHAAGLPDGGFVYVRTSSGGSDSGIFMQRYDPAGAADGPELRVNATAAHRESDPQIVALDSGGLAVVWRSAGHDIANGGIAGRLYDAGGKPFGHEFPVNATTSGIQGDPAVGATRDGGFIVSWVSGPVDGIGDIYAQRFDASGVRLGDEMVIDESFDQDDSPSVAVLADGSIVYSWTATNAGGRSNDGGNSWFLASPTRIESKRFELTPNTEIVAVEPAVQLEGAEFKGFVYTVRDRVFLDPDLPYGDSMSLEASLADGRPLPGWLAFDRVTGVLDGAPRAGDAGMYDVRITATELSGSVSESILTLNVRESADVSVEPGPVADIGGAAMPSENHNPSAATLADGTAIVAWDTGSAVYAQRVAVDETAGLVFRIDAGTAEASHPRVAALTDGGFIVIWHDAGASVIGRRYDAAGRPAADEFHIAAGAVNAHVVTAVTGLDDDGFAVLWQQFGSGSRYGVFVSRFDASGEPAGSEILVASVDELFDGADIASLAGGGFVVAWSAVDASGRPAIFARRLEDAGEATGAEILVNRADALSHTDPGVTALADGGFLITWTAEVGEDDDDIFARLFDESGVPRGDAWRVNGYTDSNQRNARSVATGDGGFAIGWHAETWSTTPAEYGFIQARHFDREGNPTGDFFQVSPESTMRETGPVLTADATGGFDVIWGSDHDQLGAVSDAVKRRHFSVGGSDSKLLPVVTAPLADMTIEENARLSFFIPSGTITSRSGGALQYLAALAGSKSLPAWLTFDPASRLLQGTPRNEDVGNYRIAVTGTDETGAAVSDVFGLTVENVNQAPSGLDDVVTMNVDHDPTFIVLDVLANDHDVDPADRPGALSLDSVALVGDRGAASIVDNRLRFDPGSDFDDLPQGGAAEVQIAYSVSDTSGAVDTGLATIVLHKGDLRLANDPGSVTTVTAPATYYGAGTFDFRSGSSGSRVLVGADESLAGQGGTTVRVSDETGTISIGRASGNGPPAGATVETRGVSFREAALSLGSLVITFAGSDLEIHIEEFNPADVFAEVPVVDTFVFNGIEYPFAELLRLGFDLSGTTASDVISGTNTVDRINGGAGDDELFGGDGDDTIVGGPGNDIVDGGTGNDTYVFSAGDGHDVITDGDGNDRIVVTDGLSSSGAVRSRVMDDLLLTLSPDDSILLSRWFSDPVRRIESLTFAGEDSGSLAPDAVAPAHGNHAPAVAVPLADGRIVAGAPFSFPIPDDTFSDPDENDELTLSASLGDGGPLPAWLNFDPATKRVNGTAPGDLGNVTIKITVTDAIGFAASDDFTLGVLARSRTMRGTAFADVLAGSAQRDRLFGMSGDDRIYGYAGNDRLSGGTGADHLYGGSGNDVFFVRGQGPGADTINGGSGFDTLRGGRGDDEFVLDGFSGANRVERIDGGAGFDSVVLARSGIMDFTGVRLHRLEQIRGSDGDDVIVGNDGPNTIAGGRGDDVLSGKRGADTYRFGRFDGTDTIVETDSGPGDTIELGADVAPGQIWFSRSRNDLRLDLLGTADAIIVRDWYRRRRTVERFETADGSYLLDDDVAKLVQAMAAFDVPPGNSDVLPPDVGTRVEPLIATAWHASHGA